jgi:hypothetical protein
LQYWDSYSMNVHTTSISRALALNREKASVPKYNDDITVLS